MRGLEGGAQADPVDLVVLGKGRGLGHEDHELLGKDFVLRGRLRNWGLSWALEGGEGTVRKSLPQFYLKSFPPQSNRVLGREGRGWEG